MRVVVEPQPAADLVADELHHVEHLEGAGEAQPDGGARALASPCRLTGSSAAAP
ncbi:MAG: hypothetical protein MZV64_73390 [Ignavibacteriales bacterium]|nr:hypothetical protein [Ignavibacteriales bacterium]